MALAANPDAANPPAVAIPEALPLPIATVILGDIGRSAAVIAVTRPVVIAGPGKRAADDSAADQTGCPTGGDPAAAGFGSLRRRHGRHSKRGDSSERHQCLPHGFT